MYRLAHLLYRMVTAVARWGRLHFTTAGFAVLGGIFFAAITGFQTETYRALSQQVLCLLLALLLLAMLWSVHFRTRLGLERRLPRFASVGLPVRYTVSVRNLAAKVENGLIVRERFANTGPNFAEFAAAMKAHDRRVGSFRISQRPARPGRQLAKLGEAMLPAILPDGEGEVSLELTPLRRGILRFAGMHVGRPDPLGLFKSVFNVDLPGTLLVLPKRYPIPPVALPGTQKYQQGGVAMASSIGLSDEFVALRDYRPGDPLRRIHWKSWAKTGTPVVKDYEDEFFVRHALILDTFSDDPDNWAFEEAVSIAASFACTINTQESLLDLLFVGTQAYCFTAGRGLAHTEQMLEILAAVRVCHDKPFAELSHLVMNHVGVVSGCIAIFLGWDEARRELITRLRALGVPILVLLVAEEGKADDLRRAAEKLPAGECHIIEVGKVAEGLARL